MLEHQSLEQDANMKRKNHTQWFPRCHATQFFPGAHRGSLQRPEGPVDLGAALLSHHQQSWLMLCFTATGLKEELV